MTNSETTAINDNGDDAVIDIVDDLRQHPVTVAQEAADEIEALRAVVRMLGHPEGSSGWWANEVPGLPDDLLFLTPEHPWNLSDQEVAVLHRALGNGQRMGPPETSENGSSGTQS